MKFQELKILLKKLFNEYVKKHLKRILLALVLSIIVAMSTSGIAWLLDPAVKEIFIEQKQKFTFKNIMQLINNKFKQVSYCRFKEYQVSDILF